jgi:hypothetical protein
VFRLNAVIRGTEVVRMVLHQMHPFYSIAKNDGLDCFRAVKNLRNVKYTKLVFQA